MGDGYTEVVVEVMGADGSPKETRSEEAQGRV